ncbi:nucleotidyltransferase domain-containing protein [Candidatus Micrarchaeota archaeon]|nr:nucleotidyltransferase domain-containing protein [Candidatus Micrarchaeota archaeon]
MLNKYALLKVMETVLGNSNTSYSVIGASKESKVSVFAAKKSLDYLFKKEMITLEKIGRTYQYKADLDNFLTREWKRIFSLEQIHNANIVKKIIEHEKIFNIVLYGSVGEGRDDEKSDIDILIIAEIEPKTKREIIKKMTGTKREINVLFYSPIEWHRKAKNDKAFYDNAIVNSVVLYGEKPVVL